MSVRAWLRTLRTAIGSLASPRRPQRRSQRAANSFRPLVEQVEDRTMPSTIFTTGDNYQSLIAIDTSTGLTTQVALLGLGQGQFAGAVAFTPDGTLWTVVTTSPGQSPIAYLATVNVHTGAINNVVGQGSAVTAPILGLQSDAAGNLFAEANDGRFYAVNKGSGVFFSGGVLSSPDLGFPNWTDLAVDSAGNFRVVGVQSLGQSGAINYLFEIDRTNPNAVTVINESQITGITTPVAGLMIDPATDTFYVTSEPAPSALYRLTPSGNTLAATSIASFNLSQIGGGDLGPSIAPATPGLYAAGGYGTGLIAINDALGQATTIGSFNLFNPQPSNPQTGAFAGAYTADGRFWTIITTRLNGIGRTAQLAQVNLQTGALMPVGTPIGLQTFDGVIGLEGDAAGNLLALTTFGDFYDVTTTGLFQFVGNIMPSPRSSSNGPFFTDLSFDNGGNLWAILTAPGLGSSAQNFLTRLDPVMGAVLSSEPIVPGQGGSLPVLGGLMINPSNDVCYVSTFDLSNPLAQSTWYGLDLSNPNSAAAIFVGAGLGNSASGGDYQPVAQSPSLFVGIDPIPAIFPG